MLLFEIYFVLNILCILVYGHKQDDKKVISIDYYGRGLLRHTRVNLNCDLDLHKEYCRFKCSKNPAVCIGGNCYCVKDDMTIKGQMKHKNIENSEELSLLESAKESSYLKNHPLYIDNDPKNQRRHHIAHFCPNLEEARKCIRKCMTQGRPAFCGKDHVCYCGHKTKSSKDQELNITAMYAQFKDLYDKYFGAPHKESEENKDYNNDIVDAHTGEVDHEDRHVQDENDHDGEGSETNTENNDNTDHENTNNDQNNESENNEGSPTKTNDTESTENKVVSENDNEEKTTIEPSGENGGDK